MIQFNLLPDVKQEFIKTKRTSHLVLVSSIAVAGAALLLMIFLFLTVQFFQKGHINNLAADIKTDSAKLQQEPDLNKILTVQNQLNSLSCPSPSDLADHSKPCLHDRKPAALRLFTSVLPKVIPASVSLEKIDLDFSTHALTFTGGADALSTVNKFVDTLKFTTFKTGTVNESRPAFSKVVLTSFSLNQDESDAKKKANFQINLEFDPIIFDNAQTVSLDVPSAITTRSETEKPRDLFQKSNTPSDSTEQTP